MLSFVFKPWFIWQEWTIYLSKINITLTQKTTKVNDKEEVSIANRRGLWICVTGTFKGEVFKLLFLFLINTILLYVYSMFLRLVFIVTLPSFIDSAGNRSNSLMGFLCRPYEYEVKCSSEFLLFSCDFVFVCLKIVQLNLTIGNLQWTQVKKSINWNMNSTITWTLLPLAYVLYFAINISLLIQFYGIRGN